MSAVPPRLTDVLTALAAEVDASDLTPSQVRQWLAGLPVGLDEEASVVWVADRIGARMTFGAFVSNFDDLWFPAMDDVVVLLDSRQALDVLVLDHEERITFSRVNA